MEQPDTMNEQMQVRVLNALDAVLCSAPFCKAERMQSLLRFLVHKKLRGAARDTAEYAIGIQVFHRDPASYDTCFDPIVRVQVGRLRQRLAAYYAAAPAVTLRFHIPVGRYFPDIEQCGARRIKEGRNRISIPPIVTLTDTPEVRGFARGLREELCFHLFHALGKQIVWCAPAEAGTISHRLEGCVRDCEQFVRTSMRLIEVRTGDVAWSTRVDRSRPCTVRIEEDVAAAVSSELCGHLRAAMEPHR